MRRGIVWIVDVRGIVTPCAMARHSASADRHLVRTGAANRASASETRGSGRAGAGRERRQREDQRWFIGLSSTHP